MKRLFDSAGILLASAISLSAFIGVLFFLRAFGEPLWSGPAASWVQAVGSIAAIWGAFSVASHQQRVAEERERATAARLVADKHAAVAEVVRHACALVLGVPGQQSGRADYEMHMKLVRRTAFENVRSMLHTAPIYEIQDKHLVAQILVTLDMVDGTIALLAKIDGMPATERIAYWPSIRSWVEDQRRNARGVLDNLQSIGIS